MRDLKRTATVSGILFIIATAAGVLSVALLGSILDPEGLLDSVAADEGMVLAAALASLILAGAVIAIPVVMYPVLREDSEGVARGYLAARLAEGMIIIAGAISLLMLVTVSQESVESGGEAVFGATGTALVAAHDWTDVIGTQLVFGITALILNASMFRTLLVPRFISVWGLIGAALAICSSLAIVLLDLDPFATTSILFFLPIAIQEMVMAVWFIVKGFNPESINVGTA
ncbi:MAG: DUF4386 domain-containing protein [Acidimicrobiia bacterium]